MTAPDQTETEDRVRGRPVLAVIGTMDRLGGAERVFRRLTAALADNCGLDVRYASHLPPTDPLDAESVTLRPGGRAAGPGMLWRLRSEIAALPRGAVLFPFQIHSNILAVAANRLLARRHRASVVINDRSNIFVKTSAPSGSSARMRLRAAAVRFAARWTYRRADQIVCNSKQNADFVARFLGKGHPPISTIYNPIDAADIQARFPARLREDWIDPSGPLITAHGRLVAGKGWDTLIRALVEVRSVEPNCRLRIVGEGALREELLALADSLGVRDAVDLPGHQPDPLAAIEEGDVYVLASQAEGLPNVLLEAIALGLPCVSTDCPTGPAEILTRDGRCGILVPVDDVDAIATAIGELLSQPAERARMGAAAATRALDFSLERAIAGYRDVLGEV